MSSGEHTPVLAGQTIDALVTRDDGVYVDATYGRGGHTVAIVRRLGAQARVLAVDRDPEAVSAARESFESDDRVEVVHGRFGELDDVCRRVLGDGRLAGVLADLGVSSPQLDRPERGFSFTRDGPLDMRMDPGDGLSAAEWLERVDAAELAGILRRLGEERFASRIARAVVAARPVRTTGELARLVAGAVPTREPGKHPATRTFQAIRMHLNDELGELDRLLEQATGRLAPGGRLVVISFHSLEDRRVKRFMRREAAGDPYPPDLAIESRHLRPRLRIVAGPLRPDAAEIDANPRARSAVLRVAERLGDGSDA